MLRILYQFQRRTFAKRGGPQKFKSSGKKFSPAHLANELMMKDRSTKLRGVISNEIRMAGNIPMTMARFMELALLHPEFGYYSTKDRIFNKGGDFTTSPEISQMFGEMLGIWLLTALKNYGDKAND